MGLEDLTKQYSGLFEKRGVGRALNLIVDIYRSGKSREILSFIVWEGMHKLGFFPKKDYLIFVNDDCIQLKTALLDSESFQEKVDRYFMQKGIGIERAQNNWKQVVLCCDGEIIGCVYPDERILYKCEALGKPLEKMYAFPDKIKGIYISSKGTIFVCLKGALFRSDDSGCSFEKTLDLGSSESFYRFNNAMTETPNQVLIVGEYGNIWDDKGWRNLANLYFSQDDGKTWLHSNFLKENGINKHVHIVKYSRLFDKVFLADGDNHKKLWLSSGMDAFDMENPGWRAINKFHIQMGGYTSSVESDGKVFFGTDYQGGTNFLVETTDGESYRKWVVPDPYRRSPIDNMLVRKSKDGDEIWANLPFSTSRSKCLLMFSKDNGQTWHKVFEYNRSAHTVWLVSSESESAADLYFSVEDVKNDKRIVYRVTDNL